MSGHHDRQVSVTVRLRALVDDFVRDHPDTTLTPQQVAHRLLDAAVLLTKDDLRALVAAKLALVARVRMPHVAPTFSAQRTLPGFEGVPLPARIASPTRPVPKDAVAGDIADFDADGSMPFVPLHKATIYHGKQNIAMRRALIRGSTQKCDVIVDIGETALRLGGTDDDVIAEVLRRGLPPPGPGDAPQLPA